MTEVNDEQLTSLLIELQGAMKGIGEVNKLLPLGNRAARIEHLARSIGFRCNDLMHLWERHQPQEVE